MGFPAWRRTSTSAPHGGAADEGTVGAGGAGRGSSRLRGDGLTLAYDRRVVADGLSVRVPDAEFTVIVGPNACGKSTLLRALARVMRPSAGLVELDGVRIASLPSKEIARRLGLLPQTAIAPDGITVTDLVSRGRYPHQTIWRQWSAEDERTVRHAMEVTGVADLGQRFVDELSGGQRQRVWLAMTLAQETPIVLLDEPTTFLDIAHQIDVLDLCADLHENHGRTLVVVLHDLNQACRYATHLIVMSGGRIMAEGAPAEIVTAELVEATFGLACRVIPDPETGTPMIIPAARRRSPVPAIASPPGPESAPAAGVDGGAPDHRGDGTTLGRRPVSSPR